MKEFEDDNFEFDENCTKFSKRAKTLREKKKLLVMSNFSFSRRVFKRLVLQTRKNQGLSGKGLKKVRVPILLEKGDLSKKFNKRSLVFFTLKSYKTIREKENFSFSHSVLKRFIHVKPTACWRKC